MINQLFKPASSYSPSFKNKLRFICQKAYKDIMNSHYRSNDEWGICINCGHFTRFNYREVVNSKSKVVISCQWDEKFTEEINITNTLDCSYCFTKFRVRCAAESLLKYSWKSKFKSINDLFNYLKSNNSDWKILETASRGGIFSSCNDIENIMKCEYFDDVDRGFSKNGIRSEDLQKLTFEDNTFDALIALDVFEHISNPWKAFSEVKRVIKPSGFAIITVPIDIRIKTTTTIAKEENGEIKYFRQPAYHLDPLRPNGAPVFTEFGTDIADKLRNMGYQVFIDVYKTDRKKINQFVILISK